MIPFHKYGGAFNTNHITTDDNDGDFPTKQKRWKKRSMRQRASHKLPDSKQPVVYLRRPETDWASDNESKDMLDYDLPSQNQPKIKNHQGKFLRNNEMAEETLGDIPSLTYNQKMRNWFVLNQSSETKAKLDDLEDKILKLQREQRASNKITERNNRLKLLERQTNRFAPMTEKTDIQEQEIIRKPGRSFKKGFELKSSEDEKEIKYTRLFDGVANIKGDFEKAKLNMGVTIEPPTKEELRQQRWDVVLRKHLQEKIEAGQKGYVDVRERRENLRLLILANQEDGNQKENQTDVINGLRKSIQEISMKISTTPAPDFPQKPNEYTVPELKCLLDLQCKEPVPKFTVGQFKKVLNTLGFTKNVVNYNDFVDKLDSVAMKKYGCSLRSKKLKGYLQKQSDRLISHQEFYKLSKLASTEKIHQKIQEANQNISAFLKNGNERNEGNSNRRPLLKLFPPTYVSGKTEISKTYVPPKTYREKKRIRDAEEFWKKYGKEDYTQSNWNKFRMDLEWKHQAHLMKGPGFPVQIKEKFPLIFGTDDAPVKLSPNFTTPDLIAAVNRIIHHPMPLNEMMDSYEKKVDQYRSKFPRLFRFEQNNSPPQQKYPKDQK